MNFKNQSVVIVKDDMNNAIRVSKNNAEYAHIRLSQERTMINSNGWLQTKQVTALIHGKTEELIASGIKKFKKLPGNIVIKESLTPFNKNNPDRDLKMAGNTGIVCCIDGQPIYRTTKYDATGTQEDELIAHNNGESIREANAATMEDLAAAKVSDTEESEDPIDENQVNLEDAIAEAEAEALETPADPDEDEHDELTVEDTVEEEVEEEVEVEENVFTL
tara:strand:- start:4599 stop:5258 length:660 start_codon:yes stop_codon:yes gene_type:complete